MESLTPSQARLCEVLGWASNSLTIAASLVFLVSFFRQKSKTVGHYMILILSISDLAIPINHMIGLNFNEEEMYPKIFFPIMMTVLHFSLYWAATMAYFTYLVIVQKVCFDLRRYVLYSLGICLLLSPYTSILPMIPDLHLKVLHLGKGLATVTYASDNHWLRLFDWVFYDAIGTMLPVGIIGYCYFKMQQALKTSFQYTPYISRNKANSTRVYLYIAIPIVCFSPMVLMHFINIFFIDNEYPFGVVLFLATLRRIWGFLNLLAYWFFKPDRQGGINASNDTSLVQDAEAEAEKNFYSQRKTIRVADD